MPERKTRPKQEDPLGDSGGDGDSGPETPDVDRPDNRELLDRMRRVDPRQARRYRQRSGE
jgi:hypothetical protein